MEVQREILSGERWPRGAYEGTPNGGLGEARAVGCRRDGIFRSTTFQAQLVSVVYTEQKYRTDDTESFPLSNRRTLRAVTKENQDEFFLSPSFRGFNRRFVWGCVMLVSDQRCSLLSCTDTVDKVQLKKRGRSLFEL